MLPFRTTLVMKSNVSKTLAVLFMASLGSACGSSSGTSDTSVDGSSDARNSADRSSTDEASSSDDSNAMDDGSRADDALTDDASLLDGATAPPVNLGTAGDYVILSKSGISTVPPSVVTGDLGASPVTATAITGFSLIADSTKVFSTSTQVTGKVYASNYTAPTPSNLTTAISDMQLAFTDAAGRAPDVTDLGAGSIGGMTLTSGVYKWGTGVLISTDITLSGSSTDVWIFQIAKTLTVSSAAKVVLAGGALSKNIFWQVSGAVDLGTTSHLEGVILTQTMIALETGASINGRLLAQTEVSLEKSTVVEPTP
jgi:hypothetical protein